MKGELTLKSKNYSDISKRLMMAQQRGCLNKDNTNRYDKVGDGKPTRPQPYTKNWRQPSNDGNRRDSLLQRAHTKWLSNIKESAMKK